MHRSKVFFIKLFQWEHWPTYMFYVPLIPYYLWCASRARHLGFYLIANPAIKYSGNGSESKFKTLSILPKKYAPKSLLVKAYSASEEILSKLQAVKISYPLIAKPDIGFRGYLVKKIDTEKELFQYLTKNQTIDIILQEYIQLPNECGIFYYRIPGEKRGTITSITLKKFLTLTGDGISNLKELIKNDERAFLYWDLMKSLHANKLDLILAKDKKLQLSVIGNHSKGTMFINGNKYITKELEKTLDHFFDQIDGWHYGRLDLKYESFKDLINNHHFKVLELNGIIAEPTHIYDPENCTYLKALKTIQNHWCKLYTIATTNHQVYKIAYPKIMPYIKDMLQLRKHAKNIKALAKNA